MKKIYGSVLLTMICFILCTTAYASDGLVINQSEYYYSESPLSLLPATYEAEVKFSSSFSSSERGGVILGNYDGYNICVNFEIYSGGHPRLYIMNSAGGTAYNYVFDSVSVFNDKWTHIAVTADSENSVLRCYIDGELAQTIYAAVPESAVFTNQMVLGGDRRGGNSMYMKGSIRRLALYSDVRTSSEIASDYSSDTFDTSDIISCYKVECDENGDEPLVITDLSGSNDYSRYVAWVKQAPDLSDYAYSFAVVGDTQIMNCYHPDKFHHIYDHITENAQEDKLKFVFGLGDITDKDSALEWSLARALIKKLDGVVPYSLVRGNHDSSSKFNSYLSYDGYTGLLEGTYGSTLANSYQSITVCGRNYLIFCLDYGASDDVLSWAGDIIEANPYSNVIITTHAYLYRDGTTLDEGDVCPPSASGGTNNGDHMWDKLIKKHKNIVLVLCGHDPSENIVFTQTKGDNGNTVSQMLIDPQGLDANSEPTGLVAKLYFSRDGKTVQVRYYSTVKDAYYKQSNQFTFEIDVIEPEQAPVQEPEIAIDGIGFNVKLTSDNALSGKVVAVLYGAFGRVSDVKIYDAAEEVKVSFDTQSTGEKIKVMWWNGTDTVIPLCLDRLLEMEK